MTIVRSSDLVRFAQREGQSKRLILIHGPDEGGVRIRADQIVDSYRKLANGSLERLVFDAEVLNADPGRLMDEAQAFSMFSTSRIILVSGANKLAKATWQNALAREGIETPIIFVADELSKASPLRQSFEAANHAAVIACYPASRSEIQAFIESHVKSAGMTMTAAAASALADLIGSDLSLAERELEKLLLYCHGHVAIEVEDVAMMLVDTSDLSLNEAIDRAFEGKLEEVEASVLRCVADGLAPSGLIVLALGHASALRRIVVNGAREADIKSLHFKRQDRVRHQSKTWTLDQLSRAVETLAQAQMQMRKTPAIEETLAIRALWSIALASRRR